MLTLSPPTRFSAFTSPSSFPQQNPRPHKIRRLHHSSEDNSSPPPLPIASPPPFPSLTEINQKYRASFYPIEELPSILTLFFQSQKTPTNLVADYAKSHFHPYVIAPELIDPKIPLEESLEQEFIEDEPMRTQIRQQKPEISGSNGTVRFVRFKNDPKQQRWFALKQEVVPEDRTEFLTQFHPPSPLSCLDAYANNCRIFSKIAGHPSFMKIFGLVVKEEVACDESNRHTREVGREDEGEVGAAPPFSPFLILENLEGENLFDLLKGKVLSLPDQYQILEQFIAGILFLFEKRIIPFDAFSYNLIVTEDKQLKFIDFDMWKVSNDDLGFVAGNVYEIALESFKDFAREATKRLDVCLLFPPPELIRDKKDIRRGLATSLKNLLEWYKEITE
jgi:hypothetical protein